MSLMRSALAAALLVATTATAPALVGEAEGGGGFAAHVVMVLKRASQGASFCSAAVVARDVVLTAAHCVGKPQDTRLHFRDEAGRPQLLPVAAIAVHPQYRPDAIRTRQRTVDLALVRMPEPLPAPFAPVRIGAPALAIGTPLRIAGFGVAREGRADTSGVLRSGPLEVREPLSSILVWARDPHGRGFGACTGDSGGPIFSGDGAALVAITDWSAGNGRGGHCGGLTQGTLVAPQSGWIESVLDRWRAR